MADEYIKREDAKIILQRAWIEDPFRRQEAFDELNSIPPADVQPVVHGKWERRECALDIECKCSACGYRDFVPYHDNYWFERNFCPNCGARMDMDGEK